MQRFTSYLCSKKHHGQLQQAKHKFANEKKNIEGTGVVCGFIWLWNMLVHKEGRISTTASAGHVNMEENRKSGMTGKQMNKFRVRIILTIDGLLKNLIKTELASEVGHQGPA